jgi:hypothetical protein
VWIQLGLLGVSSCTPYCWRASSLGKDFWRIGEAQILERMEWPPYSQQLRFLHENRSSEVRLPKWI